MKNDDFIRVQELFGGGDFAGALSLLDRLQPEEEWDGSLALFRGIALQQIGEPGQAKEAYYKAVNVGIKNSTMAWKNLAVMYSQAGAYGDMIGPMESYREWLPEEREALQLLATALIEEKKLPEVEKIVLDWLERYPDDPEIVALLQFVQQNTKRVLESILLLGRIRQGRSKPTGEMFQKMLSALMSLGWLEVALDLVNSQEDLGALEADPAVNWMLAVLAFWSGDHELTVRRLQQLLSSGQLLDAGRYNVAMLLLALGNLELGWQLYHARANNDKLLWDERIPKWEGEDLAGKTILVFSEQGAGDVIQFLRFLPVLEQRGIRCVFIAFDDIVGLLKATPGARLEAEIDLGALTFDYQLQIMDLALVCGVRTPADIPADVPYLYADIAKSAVWTKRLGAESGFKVGLVWAGNPNYGNDHYRSASLFDLASFAAVPGVTWVGLQKGEGSLEDAPEGLNVLRLGNELKDFGDTAALIEALDLVITVDTSVAHLAGAMNKPVWVLLPKRGKDWRWFLGEECSPWYPSARLFTQDTVGEWGKLIRESVRPALAKLLLSHRQASESIQQDWIDSILRRLADPSLSDWRDFDAVAWGTSVPDASVAAAVSSALGLALYDSQPKLLDTVAGRAGDFGRMAWAEYSIANQAERSRACETFAALAQTGYELTPGAMAAWLAGLIEGGELAAAREVLKAAEKRFPEHREILFQAGQLAEKNGKRPIAVRYMQSACEVSPRYVEAMVRLFELNRSGNLQVALGYLERATLLNPERVEHCRLVARELRLGNCTWLAGLVFDRLCEREPSGVNLLSRAENAIAIGEKDLAKQILAEADKSVGADYRRDYALMHLQKSLEDWEGYRHTCDELMKIRPGEHSVLFTLGWTLLTQGKMKEGWDCYYRGLEDSVKSPIPVWDGLEKPGASLLVYQDQGQGDLLQFCTLVRRLPTTMRVTLAVGASARKFLRDQGLPCRIIGSDQIDWENDTYDFRCRQMALPCLLGADLLAPARDYPYFRAKTELLPAWKSRVAKDTALKVGIVWAGNPAYGNDTFRSSMLKDWLPLLRVDGISLYNLQKDKASNQAKGLPQFDFKNIIADCDNWEKTAAAVALLDLVISVDSSVMHLAAGLGVKTWGLLPYQGTDFRWMTDREDCPWYPSLTLVRQGGGEDWSAVFERIARRLVETWPGLMWRA